MASHNHDYGRKQYWDERFAEEETEFEWCHAYSEFKEPLRAALKSSDNILVIGCGNSALSADLYEDGFTDVTSIDFSGVVIEKMKQKHADKPSLKWMEMDMLSLSFPSESFDAVIEKGTLDVLFVEEKDPWNFSEKAKSNMILALSEIHRVLKKDGGVFLSITFTQPHFRLPFLKQMATGEGGGGKGRLFDWGVQVATFGQGLEYFVFSSQRGKRGTQEEEEKEEEEENERRKRMEALQNFQTVHEEMEGEDYLGRMEPMSP